jgi:chemotaxis protein methyltransferase CheR
MRRAVKNPHLRSLEQALAQHFGWQPNSAIRETIAALLAIKSERTGLDEVSYCRLAATSTGELQALAEELAPQDSSGFRLDAAMEALRDEVLPELAAARAAARRLRIWCAGCGSGEEVYLTAMLVRDVLALGDEWAVELWGSDLRGRALVTASRGRYRAAAVRGLDPTWRNRYFIGVDEPGPDRELEMIPLMRRAVSFRRSNLTDPGVWSQLDGPVDLIVCRNVLLYFHQRAAELFVERAARALAEDGYLIVSPNENGLVGHAGFAAGRSGAGVWARRAALEAKAASSRTELASDRP